MKCPRCKKQFPKKVLHPDDSLCPKCEGEWVTEYVTEVEECLRPQAALGAYKSDLIDRLRGWPLSVNGPHTDKLCEEAADEIASDRKLLESLLFNNDMDAETMRDVIQDYLASTPNEYHI